MRRSPSLGFWSVVAIGIGGMVGGGIFAVLGLAVQLAQGGTPLAFLLAGLVALITSGSYARLSVAFPSPGGTVEFLNQAFGSGLITGGLNILLWLSYVVMLSLYAYAFGSYGASFFPGPHAVLWKHVFISGIVIALTALNVLGAAAVGEMEDWIVGFKIVILVVFILTGGWSIDLDRLQPAAWSDPLQLMAGGMVIFVAYEGFELIANTACDVKDARRLIPRAYFTAVGFVVLLYVLVSAVTVGNLSLAEIASAKDYALAAAATPFLGRAGFALVGIAALLSTGSAINATLYGTSRISYVIARDGELPEELERKIWNQPLEGLFITSGLTLLAANFLDLSSISTMGSAGFLLIFAAVNAANVRLSAGMRGHRGWGFLGVVLCLGALGALLWQTGIQSPRDLWILAGMLSASFAFEAVYRRLTGRVIRSPLVRGARDRKPVSSAEQADGC